MAALRKKKKSYGNYLKSKHGKAYLEYVGLRIKAKSEVRRAVRNYKKDIAKRAKKDPKAFYRYANGKIQESQHPLTGQRAPPISGGRDL